MLKGSLTMMNLKEYLKYLEVILFYYNFERNTPDDEVCVSVQEIIENNHAFWHLFGK